MTVRNQFNGFVVWAGRVTGRVFGALERVLDLPVDLLWRACGLPAQADVDAGFVVVSTVGYRMLATTIYRPLLMVGTTVVACTALGSLAAGPA